MDAWAALGHGCMGCNAPWLHGLLRSHVRCFGRYGGASTSRASTEQFCMNPLQVVPAHTFHGMRFFTGARCCFDWDAFEKLVGKARKPVEHCFLDNNHGYGMRAITAFLHVADGSCQF
eukprot:scaffold90791_cov24-Tisochrysis_lutea.AAC.3